MDKAAIGIGGLIIDLKAADRGAGFRIDGSFRPFISGGPAQISLFIHTNTLPGFRLEGRPLASEGFWSIYQVGDKRLIRIGPPGENRPASKIAVFGSDSERGDIFLRTSGKPILNLGIDILSFPLNYLIMIGMLSRNQGALIHASGLDNRGEGIIFLGPVGAGKSTMSSLWEDEEGITLLNDDRLIIRCIDGNFWVYGTPWPGSGRIASPGKAPLKRIFFLKQANKNKIVKLSQSEALFRTLESTFLPYWDKLKAQVTTDLINRLVKEVSCFELSFFPDKTIIDVVKRIS